MRKPYVILIVMAILYALLNVKNKLNPSEEKTACSYIVAEGCYDSGGNLPDSTKGYQIKCPSQIDCQRKELVGIKVIFIYDLDKCPPIQNVQCKQCLWFPETKVLLITASAEHKVALDVPVDEYHYCFQNK